MASNLPHKNKLWEILDKGRDLTSSIANQSAKVGKIIKTTANSTGTKWQESSTLTKGLIIGTAATATAPLAIIPVLSMVGFTSAGVAAGGFAAAMQTATTASGSIFALCQSAGAVGAVAASTSVGVGLAAGVTAGGVTATVCRKWDSNPNNSGNEP